MSSSARETFWRNLIDRRDRLRLTVAAACEEAGVSPASFYEWQRKLREADRRAESDGAAASPLVPVRIVDDRVAQLTLELPHGLRLRLPEDCEETTLVRVLQAALAACGEPESC